MPVSFPFGENVINVDDGGVGSDDDDDDALIGRNLTSVFLIRKDEILTLGFSCQQFCISSQI